MTDVDKLIERYREVQEILGGCHDGYCVIKKPKGMHTNGGCQCLQDLDFMGRQYVGHLLRVAQEMTDALAAQQKRIAELESALKEISRLKIQSYGFVEKASNAIDIADAALDNTGKGGA